MHKARLGCTLNGSKITNLRGMMSEKNRVYIFDTTMRDGEQSPGASMSIEEKIQISRVFDELGVSLLFNVQPK